MQIGPEAQKAARIARESQEVIAEPSLRDADDYRIYLKEAIADIQKVVAETHVSGSKGDRLDEKLEAFAEAVREELERLATPGASHAHDILSVIPAHKESLKEDVLEALRVHLIGFFRANENELSGSIFETPLTEEQKRARSHYVQEFIANFGAHVFAVEKLGWHMNVADWPSFLQRSAEDPPAAEATEFTRSAIRRLATRKMAEFSRDFFYGPYVHATLQKANITLSAEDEAHLFSHSTKRHFCYQVLGKLDDAIIATSKTWLSLGDPDFVAKHTQGVLPPDALSQNVRYHIAVYSRAAPEAGLRRFGENVRLIMDSERLTKEMEKREDIRIVRDVEKIRENFGKWAPLVLAKNPYHMIGQWLRKEISFGDADSWRKSIMFEDLRSERQETQK